MLLRHETFSVRSAQAENIYFSPPWFSWWEIRTDRWRGGVSHPKQFFFFIRIQLQHFYQDLWNAWPPWQKMLALHKVTHCHPAGPRLVSENSWAQWIARRPGDRANCRFIQEEVKLCLGDSSLLLPRWRLLAKQENKILLKMDCHLVWIQYLNPYL